MTRDTITVHLDLGSTEDERRAAEAALERAHIAGRLAAKGFIIMGGDPPELNEGLPVRQAIAWLRAFDDQMAFADHSIRLMWSHWQVIQEWPELQRHAAVDVARAGLTEGIARPSPGVAIGITLTSPLAMTYRVGADGVRALCAIHDSNGERT